jgi:hypothetical protein
MNDEKVHIRVSHRSSFLLPHSTSTPCRDRTCRFPGWSRASHHRNRRRVCTHQCAGKDSNLRRPIWASRVTACRNRRSATCANEKTRSVSVEGFEPSTPCTRNTCSAKLRYTLISNRLCSRGESNPDSPIESRSSWPLDDASQVNSDCRCPLLTGQFAQRSRWELNPHFPD